LGINRAAIVTLNFGTALADRRRPETISPGSILARRREAKPAARVQSPALASPVAARDGTGILDPTLGGGSLADIYVPIKRRATRLECGLSATATLGCSVLPRIHKEGDDGFFAKRLGGLQPVQTLNKYEARAVHPS